MISEEISRAAGANTKLSVVRKEVIEESKGANAVLGSSADVSEKLKSLTGIIEKMVDLCDEAVDLSGQLSDIDAFNAAANILKKTADAHAGYIKLTQTLPAEPVVEDGTEGTGIAQQRSLSDLNNIIRTIKDEDVTTINNGQPDPED